MEGSFAAVDGRIYTGTEQGDLFCLDMSNGSTIWRARIGADSDSTPAVANGFVYTAAENGVVYCFRQSNGELVWKYQATGGTTKDRAGIWASPIVVDNRVFIGSSNAYMTPELRALFPITERLVYLNHAAVSPLPIPTINATEAQLRDVFDNGSLHFRRWLSVKEDARRLLASLLGARAEQVAFMMEYSKRGSTEFRFPDSTMKLSMVSSPVVNAPRDGLAVRLVRWIKASGPGL